MRIQIFILGFKGLTSGIALTLRYKAKTEFSHGDTTKHLYWITLFCNYYQRDSL